MVAWREGYVAGGGTRFFVRALGSGDDVVMLLHGWPETSAAWHRVAPILAAAGHRVVCPDLKGFGRSDAPPTGYDARTLADEISRLIRALHARKAVLVGHDWGGAVALATTFRHPGHVRALVLSNSPYRRIDLRRAWHVPLFNLPLLPELAFRAQPRLLVEAVLRGLSTDPDVFHPDVVDEYVASVSAHPRTWLAYYRTISRAAVTDAVRRRVRRAVPLTAPPPRTHRTRVPTVVVWGARDPVLPPELAREAADDLGGRLVLLDDVGHFPHEEAPEAFARAVVDAAAAAPAAGERPVDGPAEPGATRPRRTG